MSLGCRNRAKLNDFVHVKNKRPEMIRSRMMEGHTIVYGGEKILVREGADSLTGFIYTSDPARVFASRIVRTVEPVDFNAVNVAVLSRLPRKKRQSFTEKNRCGCFRRLFST